MKSIFFGEVDKGWIILLAVGSILMLTILIIVFSRIRKCPSDKIMVISGRIEGKDGKPISAKCMHGGAAFIVPFLQTYSFLDLKPIGVPVRLKSVLCADSFGVDVSANFTVAISTIPEKMKTASERLLGLSTAQIQALAQDIILGQIRLIVAAKAIADFNDRDGFLEDMARATEEELNKIGLGIININIDDISDEFGFMKEARRKAAEKAFSDQESKNL